MKKIGFIGLGHMGKAMAKNLVKHGFEVHVSDLLSGPIYELETCGAIKATSIAEMANTLDAVITMVQTGEQVKSICTGANGIFQHAHPRLLYIDSSSSDITMTRTLHEMAENRRIAMLDAPVSGGQSGAEAGSLTFMVGGDEHHFQHALPLFSAMGKKIVHAGEAGSGQAAKICNNLLLGISMIGVSEAFLLAQGLGLDSKKFFEISSHASGQCWSMTSYCPMPGVLENVPSSHDYQPGFAAKMMLKDLHLGQQASTIAKLQLPLAALATELYEAFVKQGGGEMDFSGILTYLERLSSLK